MRDEWFGLGFEDMARDYDGDAPILTEPEIIRVLAVGGTHIRTGAGWVYIDAWEQLSAENRVGARLAMTPELAKELWTDLGKTLSKLGVINGKSGKKN